MRLRHLGKIPVVDPTATIAPNAVLCGDVTIGPRTYVGFGAVLVAEGSPLTIGAESIVMENAVLKSTPHHPLSLGEHVLVGPHAYLCGCVVERNVFLATGSAVFNGARLEDGCEVRIRGVVHLRTVLPADTTVPIGWIAVGDPAIVRPPNEHDAIWAVQKELDFPRTVFGLERKPAAQLMPEMTQRYARALARHRDDKILDDPSDPESEAR